MLFHWVTSIELILYMGKIVNDTKWKYLCLWTNYIMRAILLSKNRGILNITFCYVKLKKIFIKLFRKITYACLHIILFVYLFSLDKGLCYIFFNPKQLLQVFCIWCYFTKWSSVVLPNASWWCFVTLLNNVRLPPLDLHRESPS